MTLKRRSQLLRLLRRLRQLDSDSPQRDRLLDRVKARLFDEQLYPKNLDLWSRVMAL
jgi:hypothetical protein